MEVAKILALYDAEMRSDPPQEPDLRIERVGRVVRGLGNQSIVLFSDLGSTDARAAVAEQTAFFRSFGKQVEWKLFGHDLPPELGQLLKSAGYVADLPETLMVFDLSEGLPVGRDATGVEIRRVTDAAGLTEAVAVSADAFGREDGWQFEQYSSRLLDPSLGVFVAYAAGRPVSAGRLEMPPNKSFASLWGGGTAPEYRHRGIYRSLVRIRAEIARQGGYRFLTVDARETSRPILQRLGFSPLTSIVGWILKPPI